MSESSVTKNVEGVEGVEGVPEGPTDKDVKRLSATHTAEGTPKTISPKSKKNSENAQNAQSATNTTNTTKTKTPKSSPEEPSEESEESEDEPEEERVETYIITTRTILIYVLALMLTLVTINMCVMVLFYYVHELKSQPSKPVVFVNDDVMSKILSFQVVQPTESAQSLQQPKKGQWKRYSKRDSPNHNIGNWSAENNFGVTLDECKARCESDSKCKGFGFNPKHKRGSYCVMKHKIVNKLKPWNGDFYVKL